MTSPHLLLAIELLGDRYREADRERLADEALAARRSGGRAPRTSHSIRRVILAFLVPAAGWRRRRLAYDQVER